MSRIFPLAAEGRTASTLDTCPAQLGRIPRMVATTVTWSIAALLLCSTTAQAQIRPVVFVHGFCSDSNLWDFYWNEIGAVNGRYGDRKIDLFWDGTSVRERNQNGAPGAPLPAVVTSRFFAADLSWSQTSSRFEPADSADHSTIFEKAAYLARIIEEVKRATGSSEVFVVAHSMGGLVARAYMQGQATPARPYRHDVAALLTVGTPNDGTPLASLSLIVGPCPAKNTVNKREMIPGSPTLIAMNTATFVDSSPIVSVVMQSVPRGLSSDDVVLATSQDIHFVSRAPNALSVSVDVFDYFDYSTWLSGSPAVRPLHVNYLGPCFVPLGGPNYCGTTGKPFVYQLHSLIQYLDQSAPRIPLAPSLNGQVSGATVNLAWSSSGSAPPPARYRLYVGSTSGASDIVAGMDLGLSTSLAANGVAPGAYYARVRAENRWNVLGWGGLGPASTEVRLNVGAPSRPGSPTLNAAVVSGNGVTLSWTTSDSLAASFLLQVSYNPGGAPVATVPVAGTSVSFNGVPNGTYYARVFASNPVGLSAPSNEVPIVVGGQQPPPTGLIARWQLNGSASDDLGAWNGTLFNVSPASDRKGVASGALSFNGTNAYINVGQLHPPTSAFSISLWVKPGVSTTTTGYNLENEIIGDAGGNRGFRVFQQGSSLYFQAQGGGGRTVGMPLQASDTQRWIHIVGVFDGQARLYADGVLIDQSTVGSAYAAGTMNLQIGRDVNLSTSYWRGLLDDIQLFSRALTAVEVSNLFRQ